MPKLESIIGKTVRVKSPKWEGVVTRVRPPHPLPASYKTGRVTLPAFVEVDGIMQVKPNRIRVIKQE